MIVGRFCVELRAETETELRQLLRVYRGALIRLNQQHMEDKISVTAPELSHEAPTSFKAGTYLQPVVRQTPAGRMPPARTHWKRTS